MAAKESVNFKRSEDFESIDDELTEALSALDEANVRVLDLLETESHTPISAEENAPSQEDGEPPVEESTPQSGESEEKSEAAAE